MDKKIQNELYKDLKLALKIDKGLDHYTDDEIEKKITNSFLLPYVSLNFGDGSDNDTNFLTNLNKEDAPPFGELLKRSGINLEKSDKTSDMENFFKTVASYSSAFLWHELSTKYSKEEIEDAIKEVFKEKGIEKLFKIDSWGILFGKGLTQKNPILDNEELFETKGIDEGTNAYLMLKTVSQKLYNSSNKKEFSEEVQQAIDGIIERMEVVYKDLWGKKLIGVLMPEGKIAYSNKSKKKKYRKYLNNPNNPNEKKGSLVVYLKNISNSWFELLNVNWDTMGINSEGGPITKAFNDDGSMREYNYIPNMHLKHISNRTKWTKEYRPKLIENIGTLLSKTEKEDGIYSNVVEQLTNQLTSFLGLLDVNDHTIQLRATNLENIKNYETRVTEYLKKNATGSEGIKLMTSHVEVLLGREEITKDIFNLTAIYSLKAFQQEVLFAHKLYNGSNPVIPKITSPVLGVKFDGTLLRDNLFSDTFTSIIAGSRSGKGTLTMSLLGPLLAQGQSIIYLDNKPDIACLFWNLERSYSEKGKDVKFLCIDAKEQESTFDKGNRANRGLVIDEYGEAVNLNNVPNFLKDKGYAINKSTGFLHLLRIYKTLQLVFAIGNTFSKDNIEFNNDPIYVFIDEITDLQDRMEGLYHFIDSQTKINTAKREPKLADYAHKLAQVVKDVSNALSTIRKMASDKQNIKIVTIGQTISKEWSTDTSEVKNAKIGSLNDSLVFSCLGKTKNWLSGRGQLDPVTYKLSKTEEKFINTPGVFMKHTKKPYAPIGNIQGIGAYNSNRGDDTIKGTLFRSYFALVTNDIEDRYETVANFRTEDELKEYFNANAKSGYTNLFLNYRYEGYGYEDYMNSLKELFDEEQDKAIEGVGFEGLIQDVAKVLEKDTQSEEFIKGLNSGYNKIDTFFRYLGLYEEFGYNCIEDYLYDVSMESLFSQVELEERFKAGYNHGIESVFQKKEKPILEDSVFEDDETEDNFVEETNLGSEDIDFNNGNEIDETVEDITEIDKMNTTEETTTSKYEPKNNKTIPKPNKPTKAISRPSQSRAGIRTYSPNLEIEDNPFKTYGFDSKIGQAKGFKMLAELIENDIISMAGGLSRINNFRVNGDETLTIDSIHYSPQFPEDFLETLPFKFRTLAEEGRVSDFIDYSIVRNMDNLQSLEIESMTIANGKARQQMGLKKYQRYSSLFKKLKQLNYINICGVEYTNETVDFSDEPERTPFSLGNKLSNIFGFGKPKKKKERKGLNIPNPFGFAPTNELFDSRPVKIATSALGWTVGIKAVSLVATMLGPWGLVFGGLAAAKTYQTVKNPKPKKRKSPKPQKQKKEQAPPKIDPLEQDHNDLYS